MFLALVPTGSERVLLEAEAVREGVEVRFVPQAGELASCCRGRCVEAILVEVGTLAPGTAEAIEALRRDPVTRTVPIVAFGDSLRADLLQDATEAGAGLVLARAAFHRQLTGILRRFRSGSS
jgi:CheY-like chemotaxis protein